MSHGGFDGDGVDGREDDTEGHSRHKGWFDPDAVDEQDADDTEGHGRRFYR